MPSSVLRLKVDKGLGLRSGIHKLIWLQNAMLVTRTIRAQDIQHYTLHNIIFNRDLFYIVSGASNISLL